MKCILFVSLLALVGCNSLGNSCVCRNGSHSSCCWYMDARKYSPNDSVVEDATYLYIYSDEHGEYCYNVNGVNYNRDGLSMILSEFGVSGYSARGVRLRTVGLILRMADDVPARIIKDVIQLFVKSGQKRFALFGLVEGIHSSVLEDDFPKGKQGLDNSKKSKVIDETTERGHPLAQVS